MAERILLDTDIGSDIDDAVCLAYLLMQPDAELVGVTTVTGEAIERAKMVSAMCKVAGVDVPIYPGAENPLVVDIVQAEAIQAGALKHWPHDNDFPAGEAVAFMRRTIRANPHEITLLAIGPLTNVALLFASDPEIPSLLKRLVLMNGYFMKPSTEWNVELDPHASAMVYRANVADFRAIGLDVTTKVNMDANEVRRRFTPPLLRPVLDYAEIWFSIRPKITFHDPLAAVTLFDDSVCTFETGDVTVAFEAGEDRARTYFEAKADGRHRVAKTVKADHFFTNFFSVFDD